MATNTNHPTATYIRTTDIPLNELTPFPGNAKHGDIDQIRASLRRNGQYRSLVVRAIPDGPLTVLAGNHTLKALAAEGHTTARCELILCDDDTARRINLADNRTADLGTYDNDALAELLSYLEGDYDGTGYTATTAEYLLDYPDPDDPATGTAPTSAPISRPGDTWQLGPHTPACGDTDLHTADQLCRHYQETTGEPPVHAATGELRDFTT